MIRLKAFSPFKWNTTLLFKRVSRFSTDNKPPENKPPEQPKQVAPEETLKNAENESKTPKRSLFNFKNQQFEQNADNNPFLKKLEQIEQRQRFAGGRTKRRLDELIFPILLCLTSAFLYHCWMTLPYSTIYKHATINEYINQMSYYHAIFLGSFNTLIKAVTLLGSLSFQNMGHFVFYYPMMVYSLVLVSKFLKQRHIALIFISNSLITTAATYYFEKYSKPNAKLLTPKVNGSVTPLCFMSTFLVLKPGYLIFGSTLAPFFLLPALYYMNEWNEYKLGTINEISRPAHFTAIGYGLICGLAIRLLLTRGML